MREVDEKTKILCECNSNCCYRSCLIHNEGRPTVKECNYITIENTEKDILTAGIGDATGNFCIGQCTGKRQETGEHPDKDHDTRNLDCSCDIGWRQKNPRPNNRPNNNHNRRCQPQAARKFILILP